MKLWGLVLAAATNTKFCGRFLDIHFKQKKFTS